MGLLGNSIGCCKNPKSLVISTKLPVSNPNTDEEIEQVDAIIEKLLSVKG